MLQVCDIFLVKQLGTVYSCQSLIFIQNAQIKKIPRYFCDSYAIYQQCNTTAYSSQYERRTTHPHSVIFAKCHGKDTVRPECINNEVQICLQDN
jgi:hypothetical protein